MDEDIHLIITSIFHVFRFRVESIAVVVNSVSRVRDEDVRSKINAFN